MIDFLNYLVSMVSVSILVISNWDPVFGLCVTSHAGQGHGLAGREETFSKKSRIMVIKTGHTCKFCKEF